MSFRITGRVWNGPGSFYIPQEFGKCLCMPIVELPRNVQDVSAELEGLEQCTGVDADRQMVLGSARIPLDTMLAHDIGEYVSKF